MTSGAPSKGYRRDFAHRPPVDALAEADAATLRRGLAPLADGYARWLDERAADVPSLPVPLRLTGDQAVETARHAAARIRAGITDGRRGR